MKTYLLGGGALAALILLSTGARAETAAAGDAPCARSMSATM